MTIQELREKRAKAWDTARDFLDSKRNASGLLSEEDGKTYDAMEQQIVDLGKEIDRLERQEKLAREMSAATTTPVVTTPGTHIDTPETPSTATAEYSKAFWNNVRNRSFVDVRNALQIGEDTEGGYLVPDEFEKKLIAALEEENVFRPLATRIQTAHGDRKIPVITQKGEAVWMEEEEAYTLSDDAFGQIALSAYKVGTAIKISEELLNDSVFDLPSYIAKEFARRIGTKEEEAFLIGDGKGKPTGIFAATGGAENGATTAGAAITFDDMIELFYSLKSPYRKKAVWVLNEQTVKALRKVKDSNGQYIWQPSVTAGVPDTIAKGAVATFVGNALTSLVDTAVDAVQTVGELSDSTMEFRENLAKLQTTAESAGYSTEYASGAFSEMYGVLGDETAATTTISNFMKLETSTDNLNNLLNSATGIWAVYGDSIPLDGLAESVNETAKVGQITGNLADALNWAGLSEDSFNESLAACTSEQERQQLIVDTLNSLYGESADKYRENNASIIAAREANLAYEESLAAIGGEMEPLNTQLTNLKAQLLSSLIPGIQQLCAAFQNLFAGVAGAEADVANAVLSIINAVFTQLQGILPKILAIISAVLAGVLQSISGGLPSLLAMVVSLVQQIFNTVLTAAPMLLSAVLSLLQQIISTIVTYLPEFVTTALTLILGMADGLLSALPDIINAAITLVQGLISGLVSALPQIANAALQLVQSLCNALLSNLPALVQSAVTLVLELVNGILSQLPQILNAALEIVNSLLSGILSMLPDIIQAAITLVNGLITGLIQNLPMIMQAALQLISGLMNSLYTSLPQIITCALDLVAGLVSGLISAIPMLIEAIPQLVMALINGFIQTDWLALGASILQAIWNGILSIKDALVTLWSDIFSSLFAKVAEWATNIWDKAKEAISNFWNSIVETLCNLPSEVWNWLCNVIVNVAQWVIDMQTKANEAIVGFFTTIIDKITNLPGEIWNWLCNVITKIATWVINMQTKANEAITGFFSAIINKITSLPGEVWNWLKNVISKVAEFGTNLGTKAKEAATGLFNNLVDGIKSLPDKIYSIGSDIVEGLWNGIGDMVGWLWDKISGFCDDIWDNIAGFFGIASPSRLFKEELGFNLVYGLAEGVDDKVKTAVRAVNAMGQDVMNAAQKSLNMSWNVGDLVPSVGASVVNNYYNNDNSRTVNQTNNSPKALSRLEIYRLTRNAVKG